MENTKLLRTLNEYHRKRLLIALGDRISKPTLKLVHDSEWNGTDTESIRIELHHIHLPMLDEMNLIDWKRDSYTIRKGTD